MKEVLQDSTKPDIAPLHIKFDRSKLDKTFFGQKRSELGVESDCVLRAMTLDEID